MMRALALLLLLGTQLHAGAAAGQYNEANALYRAGDFAAARHMYLEVVDAGVEDARIYYNLGNACFKSGQLGEAILWYERARRLLPHDEDIEANLRFANLVKQDRDPQTEDGLNALVAALVAAYFWPTFNQLSLLFAVAFFAVFVLGVRWLFAQTRPGALWLVGVLLCAGLSVGSALWQGRGLAIRRRRAKPSSRLLRHLRVLAPTSGRRRCLSRTKGRRCAWCGRRAGGCWCGWPTVLAGGCRRKP